MSKPGLSGCPYYQGTGTCFISGSCSVAGEPLCITDMPLEGWAIQSDHWWVRLGARIRYRWRYRIGEAQHKIRKVVSGAWRR